jgi:hypothetical protein
METFALPPRRTIYTGIFCGMGELNRLRRVYLNRRDAGKASKMRTWVCETGFEEFFSRVDKLDNHIGTAACGRHPLSLDHFPKTTRSIPTFFTGREMGEASRCGRDPADVPGWGMPDFFHPSRD